VEKTSPAVEITDKQIAELNIQYIYVDAIVAHDVFPAIHLNFILWTNRTKNTAGNYGAVF
jgi:hypothetical protein